MTNMPAYIVTGSRTVFYEIIVDASSGDEAKVVAEHDSKQWNKTGHSAMKIGEVSLAPSGECASCGATQEDMDELNAHEKRQGGTWGWANESRTLCNSCQDYPGG